MKSRQEPKERIHAKVLKRGEVYEAKKNRGSDTKNTKRKLGLAEKTHKGAEQ